MAATHDRLSPYIVTSAVLHATLFAAVVFAPFFFPKRNQPSWGGNNPGVKVGMISRLEGIPLPAPPKVVEGVKGNETKSLSPPEVAPKEQKKAVPKAPEVDALKVPTGKKVEKKKEPEPVRVARVEPKDSEPAPVNEIPGRGGAPALPYANLPSGGGQASFGGDGSFGTKFPQYVTNMTRAITIQWEKENIVQVGRGTSPRVYVKFTIGRRGEVSNLEIDQSSGSTQLDGSGKRAIQRASIPPLPPEYSGSSVDVRFYFEYTR